MANPDWWRLLLGLGAAPQENQTYGPQRPQYGPQYGLVARAQLYGPETPQQSTYGPQTPTPQYGPQTPTQQFGPQVPQIFGPSTPTGETTGSSNAAEYGAFGNPPATNPFTGSTNAAEYGSSGADAASGGSYKEALAYLKSRLSEGNEDVSDINPAFATALARLMQEASAAGFNFKVESGYRTEKEQAALRAARPGSPMVGTTKGSKHVKGQAVDLTLGHGLKMKFGSPEAKWLRDNAGRFGLDIPMQSPVGKTTLDEPWHIEPVTARGGKLKTTTKSEGPGVIPPYPGTTKTPAAAAPTVTPTGKNATGPTPIGTVGDPAIDKILATIRSQETPGSKAPYQQLNTSAKGKSTAGGAYQFTNDRWKNESALAGYGTLYARAVDAPASVQDRVAASYVRRILKETGGNIREVPKTWYVGHSGEPDSTMPKGPGNKYNLGQYADRWMAAYQKTNPTIVNTPSGPIPAPAGKTPSPTPTGTTSSGMPIRPGITQGIANGQIPPQTLLPAATPGVNDGTGFNPAGVPAGFTYPFQYRSSIQGPEPGGYTPTLSQNVLADPVPAIKMAFGLASAVNPAYKPPTRLL